MTVHTISPNTRTRRRCVLMVLCSLLGGLALSTPVPAAAQATFPTRLITVINPYPPGGFTDNLTRLIVSETAKILGQPIIVENRTGAAGKIGLDAILNAPRDGYTIGVSVPGALAVFPILDPKYASLHTRYAPLTLAVKTYYGVAINPNVVPARNMKDFISWAKGNERKLSYGSIGLGSSFHLWSEAFAAAAGISPLHVPYKGEAHVINDLVGGQIHFMVASAAARPFVQSGRLLVLATTGAERWDAFPDVPTFKELGMPEMETSAWFAFIAPAGVPPEVLAKLNAALTRAIKLPSVTAAIQSQGYIAVGSSAEELASTVGRETKQLAAVIKTRSLKFD
jgi:tripartite-type tricarboxylate transporter receptor subunit TctC